MFLSRAEKELIGFVLAMFGCVAAVLVPLYMAAWCYWRAAAEPERGNFWAGWFFGLLGIALLGSAGVVFLVFRPWLKRRKSEGRRL